VRAATLTLFRLRVACDLAIDAVTDLGKPLPRHLERQIEDLDVAIQVELEQRDPRFIDITKPS
jgi:hypothetical protein